MLALFSWLLSSELWYQITVVYFEEFGVHCFGVVGMFQEIKDAGI